MDAGARLLPRLRDSPGADRRRRPRHVILPAVPAGRSDQLRIESSRPVMQPERQGAFGFASNMTRCEVPLYKVRPT